MTIGNLIHKEILDEVEKNFKGRVVVEKRFTAEYNYNGYVYKVSAKPDLFAVKDIPELNLKAGELRDLKTPNTGNWYLEDDNWRKYRYQLNFNRWILEENGYNVTSQRIWFIFTDWTDYQAKKNEGKTWKQSGRGYPKPEELVDVERLSIPSHIDSVIAQHDDTVDYHDDDLPDCERVDTFEKPPWKVYRKLTTKDGLSAKAIDGSGQGFPTEQKALEYADWAKQNVKDYKTGKLKYANDTLVVQYRKEFDRPGCEFCNARHWCNIYKQRQEGGAYD